MDVLLLRPHPGNDRFGLGPFFQVEPLGLEYLGTALRRAGFRPSLADLRFPPSLARVVRRARPALVGISCLHALEYERVVETARAVKRLAPGVHVIAGGHAAAAYPAALEDEAIDGVCVGDGEEAVVAAARAVREGRPLAGVAGVRAREGGRWVTTPAARVDLDAIDAPARDLAEPYRRRYRCLQHRPVWLVETARGCPFRCSFCAVWSFNERTFRERSIGSVVEDFRSIGDRVFVVDDLFFHTPARSLELARALRRAGVRKRWILVQSRADLVARRAELLEAWRDLADRLDVFFGFEAPTDAGLASLSKDSSTEDTVAAIELCRGAGVGVTGNFVVDPDWEEADFERLWGFVARHELRRAGYTILTPLPGTPHFEKLKDRVRGQPWWKYDMHHLLWEPRLGARRFFELFAETWRRSVLNLGGDARALDWVKRVRPREAFDLARVLVRTQRMMHARSYLAEL